MAGHVRKLWRGGQVTIPAAARSRWQIERVIVVDLGDRLVIRPLPDEPVGAAVGTYAGRGPSSREARQAARGEDVRHGGRKRR